MSSKKLRFRPTVQTLETRRCMAAAIGDLVAEPTDGSSAIEFADGWGMAMYQYGFPGSYKDEGATDGQLTTPEEQTKNEPFVSEIKITTWPLPAATAEDDVIVDGRIITAENYDAVDNQP